MAAIESELSAASFKEKTRLLEQYSEQFGISRATLYRRLQKYRGKMKEVKRDKKIDQDLIDEIAKLKMKGFNGIADRELATDICIDILKRQNKEGAESLSVSTVNRRLRESGFRQKEKIVRVEASYANEQHQLDFSRSKYFQLWKYDEASNDYLLKATSKNLTYKEDDKKLRTWLVGITDAYSRVSLAQAVAASGESVLIGIGFLNFAYAREDDQHPLKYIPDILKTDNGSFIKSVSVKDLLRRLEIKSELSEEYKKRGIQKREAAWRLLWQRFELRNYIMIGEGKTITLADYNGLLHEFMVECLDMKHPTKNETRGHVYRTSIAQHPPRKINVDLKEIIAVPQIRTVSDDCCISLNNQKYEVSNPKLIDKRIRVYKNLHGDVIGELVDEYSKPFELKAVEGFVRLGDFAHRDKSSYKNKIEKEVKAEKINYLPPREKVFTPENKFRTDESFENELEAKLYVANQLGSYEPYADVFNTLFVDTLYKKDIDEVINYVKNKAINL